MKLSSLWTWRSGEEKNAKSKSPVLTVPAGGPQDSSYADFCRTLEYSLAIEDISMDIRYSMEALRNPVNGRWDVYEATQRPDGSGKIGTVRKPVEKFQSCTFMQAIVRLAAFEEEQKGYQYKPVGKTAEDLGVHYYRTLANYERIIFDSYDTPAYTVDGRPMGSGFFMQDQLDLAEKYTREHPPVPKLQRARIGLAQIFGEAYEAVGLSPERTGDRIFDALRGRKDKSEKLAALKAALEFISVHLNYAKDDMENLFSARQNRIDDKSLQKSWLNMKNVFTEEVGGFKVEMRTQGVGNSRVCHVIKKEERHKEVSHNYGPASIDAVLDKVREKLNETVMDIAVRDFMIRTLDDAGIAAEMAHIRKLVDGNVEKEDNRIAAITHAQEILKQKIANRYAETPDRVEQIYAQAEAIIIDESRPTIPMPPSFVFTMECIEKMVNAVEKEMASPASAASDVEALAAKILKEIDAQFMAPSPQSKSKRGGGSMAPLL